VQQSKCTNLVARTLVC